MASARLEGLRGASCGRLCARLASRFHLPSPPAAQLNSHFGTRLPAPPNPLIPMPCMFIILTTVPHCVNMSRGQVMLHKERDMSRRNQAGNRAKASVTSAGLIILFAHLNCVRQPRFLNRQPRRLKTALSLCASNKIPVSNRQIAALFFCEVARISLGLCPNHFVLTDNARLCFLATRQLRRLF